MCALLARDLSRCASHRSSSRHDASARLLMGKVHTPLDGSLWHGLAIDSASSNLTWQGLQSAPSMAVSRWSTSTCPRRSKRRSAWHNMRVRWPSCASSRCLRTRYAFRCHREKKDGLEHVYPVNALAFNPVYVGAAWRCGLYFLSHGCNPCTAMARLPLEAVMAVSARGTASTASDWPTFRDSRLGSCTLLRTLCGLLWYAGAHQCDPRHSIAALAFNKDGTELAIAASYTYEKGEPEEPVPDTVTIRTVAAKEVLPKAKKSKAAKK